MIRRKENIGGGGFHFLEYTRIRVPNYITCVRKTRTRAFFFFLYWQTIGREAVLCIREECDFVFGIHRKKSSEACSSVFFFLLYPCVHFVCDRSLGKYYSFRIYSSTFQVLFSETFDLGKFQRFVFLCVKISNFSMCYFAYCGWPGFSRRKIEQNRLSIDRD